MRLGCKVYDLWKSMVPPVADFFLPRMLADMSAFTDRMATSSDLAGMLSAALLLVKVPTFAAGGAEGVGNAGTHAAPLLPEDDMKTMTF